MRVLDQADMTSREACGNVVRNVCASTMAGVEPGEAFDVTASGMALARFLDYVQSHDDAWICRRSDIAQAWAVAYPA